VGTWTTKSSKVVYENPWLLVREDKIIHPNGKDGMYGVVESKSDAVFVVPIDSEGNVSIIQQEHYSTKELAWQCVAGRTDGEQPEIAAKRELLEEAGLDAGEIIVLSRAHTASGLTTFRSTICLARQLTPNADYIDEGEGIATVIAFSIPIIHKMILEGEISNTESIAALFLAFAYLEKEKTV